jgi:hypothetical protein
MSGPSDRQARHGHVAERTSCDPRRPQSSNHRLSRPTSPRHSSCGPGGRGFESPRSPLLKGLQSRLFRQWGSGWRPGVLRASTGRLWVEVASVICNETPATLVAVAPCWEQFGGTSSSALALASGLAGHWPHQTSSPRKRQRRTRRLSGGPRLGQSLPSWWGAGRGGSRGGWGVVSWDIRVVACAAAPATATCNRGVGVDAVAASSDPAVEPTSCATSESASPSTDAAGVRAALVVPGCVRLRGRVRQAL